MSAISTWSTTAASNNSAAPNGFPEGMPASGVNDACRELMASVRTWHDDVEWRDFGDTPTRTGNTTFTVPTDLTDRYVAGRPIRCTDSSTLYGYITGSTYAAVTTVTVSLDSGNLSASLSAVSLGTLPTNEPVPGTAIRWIKGADVASANALTLGSDGNYFDITGTTAITSITTVHVGAVRKLHFDDALTLTHHATDLVLPGGANITTAAGDEAEFVEYASGDWRCTSYTKANGKAVVPFGLVLLQVSTASGDATVDLTLSGSYSNYVVIANDVVPATDNVDFFLRFSTDSGSTYLSAGNYFYSRASFGADGNETLVGNTSGTGFQIAGGLGNASDERYNGRIEIFDAQNSSSKKMFTANGYAKLNDAGNYLIRSGGTYNVAVAAITNVRLMVSSGNISGTFYLYGVQDT